MPAYIQPLIHPVVDERRLRRGCGHAISRYKMDIFGMCSRENLSYDFLHTRCYHPSVLAFVFVNFPLEICRYLYNRKYQFPLALDTILLHYCHPWVHWQASWLAAFTPLSLSSAINPQLSSSALMVKEYNAVYHFTSSSNCIGLSYTD